MMDYEKFFAMVLWLIAGLFLGSGSFALVSKIITEKRAIEKEAAYYHAKTGEIVWSDKVVKFVATGQD